MKIPSKKARLALATLVILALAISLTLWLLFPSPQDAFIRDMEAIANTASEGGHARLASWFAPSFESWVRSRYQLSLPAALQQAALLDRREKRTYRFKTLAIFKNRQHAAAIFERSAPYGRFDRQVGMAVVPFAWEDRRWVIKETNPDGSAWVTNLRF